LGELFVGERQNPFLWNTDRSLYRRVGACKPIPPGAASQHLVAFEPIPDTFALLTENVRHAAHANDSLLNCAASERTATVGMEIPRFPDGLENYYQAHVVSGAAGLTILALSIDSLALPSVRLVKIDAEGHELPVLQGMRKLVERDHPILIVETGTGEAMRLLESWAYRVERLPGSSNVLCT